MLLNGPSDKIVGCRLDQCFCQMDNADQSSLIDPSGNPIGPSGNPIGPSGDLSGPSGYVTGPYGYLTGSSGYLPVHLAT